MGYRSEVAFCLQVKEPEKFVALAKLKADAVLKEMLDNMYYMPDGGVTYILFTVDYWKWYEDSQNAFRDLMKMAEDYDEDFACRFVRVGDNSDDVEEECFGEMGWDLYYPYVSRRVELGTDPQQLKKVIKEEENATTS